MIELKLERRDIDVSEYYAFPVKMFSLNMSIIKAFETLGASSSQDFFEKLRKIAKENALSIVLSEEDVDDYRRLSSLLPEFKESPLSDEDRTYYSELINSINHMFYKDIPFQENGKWGLRSSSGKTVVPPLFDGAVGALDLIYCDTLAVVRMGNKLWLTPRDGSGQIINESGYDKISRSFCYAWVFNDGKEGMLDAKTGEVVIPCEMDWIIKDSSQWLLGRKEKLSSMFVIPELTPDMTEEYQEPIYDGIDLTTGQVCLNGIWGWELKNGEFTADSPKRSENITYISRNLPLCHEAQTRYYQILDKLSSIKKSITLPRKRRCDIGPLKRASLPRINNVNFETPIHPQVATTFAEHDNRDSEFIIQTNYTQPISVRVISVESGLYKAEISWEEDNQMKMAEDKAFPLKDYLHMIVASNAGKFVMKLSISIESEDLTLVKAFLSYYLYFKTECSLINSNMNSCFTLDA